jgi:hypothetical protein
MPRQMIGSDRLTHAVPYHYAGAVTGVTLVFSAGACPLDGDGRVICRPPRKPAPPGGLQACTLSQTAA